jgi:hypothetical protein
LCPLFSDIPVSQIDQFHQGHIGSKCGFGFGNLSYLAMKPFNRIGSINQLTDIFGKLKIAGQLMPIISPG